MRATTVLNRASAASAPRLTARKLPVQFVVELPAPIQIVSVSTSRACGFSAVRARLAEALGHFGPGKEFITAVLNCC